ARQGSGTRVAAGGPAPGPVPRPVVSPRLAFDLTSGAPDVSAFPRAAWQRASRVALSAAPSEALGYPDPRGLPGLRAELASYLARVRGVRTSPEHLVICSGTTQALYLLATALAPGSVAMESHGLRLHREVLGQTGTLLPVDADGADVSLLKGDAAVLLTPAHQFPLGGALTAARRAAVLDWARAAGSVIIEDDYDGEFRYDRRPIGALQGLAPDLVAYVGTVSKTLAPGLRLGWIAVPPALLDAVIAAKRLSGGGAGVLEQLTLATFMAGGGYDRHIRRSRLRYRKRRDLLVAALAGHASVTGIAAGLHALVPVPDEAAVIARAAERGLALHGLGHFRAPDGPAADGLVIGYARPADHAFAGALEALRSCWF
ncbi:PLP-dependent aminotransferase family protein, partial [Actinoplanes sp. NPDC048791]|uniref:aminotransferase-like domain-containing protein n=1 Tax=Actinoplanes sp. NPDC048791 TaxID=3154623 RepID=UPI0033DB13D2